MKKRLVSLCLSLLMLLSLVPVSAFGATAAEFTFATSATGGVKAGDTFTVTVSSGAVSGAYAIPIQVGFPKEIFEVTALEYNTTIPSMLNTTVDEANTNGYFTGNFTDALGGGVLVVPADTCYVTATLKVKTGVSIGDKTITLNDYTPTDDVGDTIESTVNAEALTVTVYAELTGAQAVTGLTAPAKNAAPDTAVTAPTHTTAAVKWYNGDDEFNGAKFAAGTSYTAKITLTPDDGYRFADGATFTVDGNSTGWSAAPGENGAKVLTKTFPDTAAKTVTEIVITTPPTKTAYEVGDTFDPTGMVVKATYDDESVDENYANYVCDPVTLAFGATEVTVKSNENEAITTTQSVTVSKKTGTDSLFSTDWNLEYNGENQLNNIESGITCAAVTAGKLGTPVYYVYEHDESTSGTGLSSVVDAGTYDVYVTAQAGTMYDAITEKLKIGEVTIAKKPLRESDFSVNPDSQHTYNDSEQSVVYNSTLTLNTDFTVSGDKATDVETKTVTFTGIGNYTGTYSTQWSLKKATLESYSDPTCSATYGTKAKDIGVTGGQARIFSTDTVVPGTWRNSDTRDTVFGVDDHQTIEVTFEPEKPQNFEPLTVQATPAINPADYTFTYNGLTTILKGSTIASISGQTTATGVNNETVDGTLTWYANYARTTEATNDVFAEVVSAKTLYYKFVPDSGQNNYWSDAKQGEVSFNVVDIAFTHNNSPVADGNGITVKNNPTYGDEWADIVTIGGITAKVGSDGDNGTGEYTLDVSGYPYAGTGRQYVVLYSGTIGGKDFEDVEVFAGTVNVAKKSMNVTSDTTVTKVYDGNKAVEQDIIYSVTGVADDGNFNVTVSYSLYEEAGVGENKTVYLGDNKTADDSVELDNYQLNYIAPKGKITAKPVAAEEITVVTTGITKEYDGNKSAPDVTLTFEGIDSDGTITVTAEQNTYNDKDAGESKPITLGNISGSKLENYDVTYPAVYGKITKRPVTVTISGVAEVTYGTAYQHTAEATLLPGDFAQYTIIYSGESEAVNAGSYNLTVEGDNPNYIYTTAGVTTFTITKANVSHADAPVVNMRYSNTQARTITAADLGITLPGTLTVVDVNDDENDILETEPAIGAAPVFSLKSTLDPDNAGDSAVITVKFTPTDSDNYNVVAEIPVTITVMDKNEATVEVTMSGWTYGDTPAAAQYDVQLVTGYTKDNNAFTVTYAPQGSSTFVATKPVNAGAYTVKVVYEDNDNYGEDTANFTVAKKTLTFTGVVTGKTYDGNGILPAATGVALVGVVSGDSVSLLNVANAVTVADSTGKFDAGKYTATVTLTSNALTGTDKDNYQISVNTYTVSDVEIAPLPVETAAKIGGAGTATVTYGADAEAKINEFVNEYASVTDLYGDEALNLTSMTDAEKTAKRMEAIRKAMAAVAAQSATGAQLLDIQLVGGSATVVLAYPAGVTAASPVKVTHMKSDGTVELISVDKLAAGIKITVTGGSPYLVTWNAAYTPGRGGHSTYYAVTSGAEQTKAPGELTKFTVDCGSAKVSSVYVDGVMLSAGDYLVSGRTVKLQGTFTRKLTSGYHTILINYTNGGVANTRFLTQGAVVAAQTADTGVLLYAVMALTSSAAGAVWVTTRRKGRREAR